MKIVVRAPNWVGDAVLALPAIASLRRHFPEAELVVAAADWVREIYLPANGAPRVLSLEPVRTFAGLRRSAGLLRAERFDLGVLLTNSFGSALQFAWARIPARWGYGRDGRSGLLTRAVRPPDSQAPPRHHIHYYLDLLDRLGVKTVEPALRLRVPPEEDEAARMELLSLGVEAGAPLVVLSPGASYGPAKRWPADRFAAAASRLQEALKARILIIGSAGDAPIADAVAGGMARPPVSLVGRTTLRRLLAVIGRAALFLTNDTGPMHMANALRVPVVAVFGPTVPEATAPFHEPRVVLKKDVPCGPCLYRICPYDHRCMRSIETDEVVRACTQALAERTP